MRGAVIAGALALLALPELARADAAEILARAETAERDLDFGRARAMYVDALEGAPDGRSARRAEARLRWLDERAEGEWRPLAALERARREPHTWTAASVRALEREVARWPDGRVRREGRAFVAELWTTAVPDPAAAVRAHEAWLAEPGLEGPEHERSDHERARSERGRSGRGLAGSARERSGRGLAGSEPGRSGRGLAGSERERAVRGLAGSEPGRSGRGLAGSERERAVRGLAVALGRAGRGAEGRARLRDAGLGGREEDAVLRAAAIGAVGRPVAWVALAAFLIAVAAAAGGLGAMAKSARTALGPARALAIAVVTLSPVVLAALRDETLVRRFVELAIASAVILVLASIAGVARAARGASPARARWLAGTSVAAVVAAAFVVLDRAGAVAGWLAP